MFENRVQRKIFRPKKEDEEENCSLRGFVIYIHHLTLLGRRNQGR
jgi:hypothetical protein